MPAAVDEQHLAVEVATGVVEQEGHGVGDVLGLDLWREGSALAPRRPNSDSGTHTTLARHRAVPERTAMERTPTTAAAPTMPVDDRGPSVPR
jgi:hypothetical protein